MSQVISIYGGGPGIQMGEACLKLNTKEHGIASDGIFTDEDAARMDVNHDVHFRQDSLGRWTPRSIFIDFGAQIIDNLLSSEIGQLVEPGQVC